MNIVRVFELASKFAARTPEPIARGVFDVVGTIAGYSSIKGVKQLRKNLNRVTPLKSGFAQRRRSAKAMRSYLSYYYEVFLLPSLTHEQILARVTIENDAELRARFADGQAVPAALMHMGNWDLAGAWANIDLAPVFTIAEKLEPQELADQYLEFREGLGMKIYLAVKGGGAIGHLTEDMASGPRLMPILCDRDLSRSGIEVEIAGHKARIAVGASLLSQRTGTPMYPITIVRDTVATEKRKAAGSKHGIKILVGDAIFPKVAPDAPEDEREADLIRMNQDWQDQITGALKAHLTDWHMLQKVFVDDLDQARLAASREAGREETA